METTPRYFTGEFAHALDGANRVVIPAKWRTGESEELFLFATEGRITALTRAEFDKLLQDIEKDAALSRREKAERGIHLSGQFQQVTCDRQGRITLPEKTACGAKVKGDVVFVGAGYRFTIWSSGAWRAWHAEHEAGAQGVARDLGF
ncbi:MAG: division/cell wall cluster transcriptional repressor MraZ [Verrucomicrobiia bacterium]|jgi:MraZ protein